LTPNYQRLNKGFPQQIWFIFRCLFSDSYLLQRWLSRSRRLRGTNLLLLPGIEPHSSVVKLVALSLLTTQLSDCFIILVHTDQFFVNKTNRCTKFQFHLYYDSTCFGQSFCPSSGVLSRTSTLVQFMQSGDRALAGAW
jgi:hypothetical protein